LFCHIFHMRHGWHLGRDVAFAALIGLVAGCGSSSSSTSSGSTAPPATATPSGPASAHATSAPPFADIVEPFDPGHPAQAKSAPADCGSQPSTLAIVQCFENQTETTDAQIDTVGRQLYNAASLVTAKTAIVAQLGAWLTARGPVCQAAFSTGGTIDQVNIASCLLDESTARLDAMKNITPPEAKLKSTDSTDPSQLSWYTTPEGSRIAEIDTQGDQTGGAVISWVIIGGAQGFVVNPKQFFFQDGAFTDPGVIQGANPTYHQVATGQMYQFGIDYSKLSKDPNASKGSGGYVYVPGAPVAIWQ
jgi:uncharacterized protein YecT (DUF1311 family)